LTKRDYEAIAKIIASNTFTARMFTTNRYIDKESLMDDLCGFMKQDNERFDEKKFREACNYEKE